MFSFAVRYDDETHMNVLLVEDDPDCATITRHVLLRLATEVSVTIAESGEEVQFLLQQWELGLANGDGGLQGPPDMVILDLGLPGMHGLEVLALLRASPITRRIPIIIFTAWSGTGCCATPSGFLRDRQEVGDTESTITMVL